MFSRHDLVWLSARGWEGAAAAAPPGTREAIVRWGEAGWPAVVTRAQAAFAPGQTGAGGSGCADAPTGNAAPDDGTRQVALGIALPPRADDGSKARIALIAAAADIARTGPPLRLADAIDAAPAAWRAALRVLDDEAAGAGITLRVYGSLAFSVLTGQACLTARSDIDLLLHPATARGYRSALALLRQHARDLPLDGEIVFGGGQAVAWRELAAARQGQARVLAKSMNGIGLVTLDSLLASLDATTDDAAGAVTHATPTGTAPCSA